MVRSRAAENDQLSEVMKTLESINDIIQQQGSIMQQQAELIQQQQLMLQQLQQQQQPQQQQSQTQSQCQGQQSQQAEREPNSSQRSRCDRQYAQMLGEFYRFNPPSFYGSPDPRVAEDWLSDINKIFDVMCCSDGDKLRLAVFLLKGEAEHWWSLEKRTAGAHTRAIEWEYFLLRFNEKYFPASLKEEREVEFLYLVQGELTVRQYDAKFTELSRLAPHLVDTESRKARKFERGLRCDIKDRIVVLRLPTYDEVLDRALIVESSIEVQKAMTTLAPRIEPRRQTAPQGRGKRFQPYPTKKLRTVVDAPKSDRGTVWCSYCKNKGHEITNCYKKLGVCFNCKKSGHFARDCPLTKASESQGSKKSAVQTRVYAIAERDT